MPELEALLARTASAFRVGAVDLVLFSAEPNRSARSSLNRDGERRMLEPIDEPLAESLRSLAAGLTGPVEIERIFDTGQREYFRSRGMENGVLAPLHGEAGCVGPVLDRGRESVDRSFSDEDLRLLETLTGNVTVALQYDRLEQAVRQLESLQQELERKALYDSLTQLANRSLFHNRVEHALQSRRPGVCVLLLDIDEFKASTTATATTPATSCCARSRTGCAAACARATPRPASAATSSPCCSTAAAARSTR